MGKGVEVTFEEFCHKNNVTTDERRELVWYLAFLRMRRTVLKLMIGNAEG